jgi:hypothetical protein
LITATNFKVVDAVDKRITGCPLSLPQPSTALLKFQTTLKVPAVQLINRSGGYRLLSNDDQQILIAPSWQWLSMLP